MATMETDDGGRMDGGGSTDSRDPVPAVFDWALGGIAGAVGLLMAAVGVGLYTRVDRAAIADAVGTEGVSVNGLTTAEAIAAAGPFVDWLAVGFVTSGLVLVVGAALFVRARRRTRRRVAREGGTTATFWGSATYGAVVTTVAGFVFGPLSWVAGGGAAAYLNDSDGTRVGAAAGLIGTVLLAPLLVFVALGLLTGADAIGRLAGGTVLAALVVGAELVAAAFGVGLSVLGGYLVARFA